MKLPLDGRDDGALEALILLALLEDPEWSLPVLTGPEPELDPADQRALDALGPDLVRRILEEGGAPAPRDESGRA